MLQEKDRQKLDGIVRQMIDNKESDANIQFVVNDFTQKYANKQQEPSTISNTINANTIQKEKEKSLVEKAQGLAGGFAKFGYDVAQGAKKGVASTVSGLSSLGQKGLEATVGKALGVKPAEKTAGQKVMESEALQRKGLGEAVGFGAEQAAEYMIPTGTAKTLAGKAISGGLQMGTTTAAQTGEIGKEAVISTVAGATIPIALASLKSIANKVSKTAWSNILKQTPTEAIKNPKLAEEAGKTGLRSFTKEGLQIQARNNVKLLETQIDDIIKVEGKGKTISTDKIVGYLDDLEQSYSAIPGEGSAVEGIKAIKKEITAKPTMAIETAQNIKQKIYSHVAKSYGKGTMEITYTTEAQKQIARGLRQEIAKQIPKIKDPLARQAIYVQLDKQLSKSIARTTGKGVLGTGIGLYDLLIGGIGQGTGFGVVPLLAKKTAESTAVSTGTSKLINYFNTLSPTKKVMFYNAIKGLVGSTVSGSKKKKNSKNP